MHISYTFGLGWCYDYVDSFIYDDDDNNYDDYILYCRLHFVYYTLDLSKIVGCLWGEVELGRLILFCISKQVQTAEWVICC